MGAGMSLKSSFKSYLKDIEKEINKADMALRDEAATVVLADVRQSLNAPTGDVPKTVTGNLKKGLTKKNQRYSSLVGFKAPAYHAANVEFGGDVVTSKGRKQGARKPHPFLKPAFERKKGEIMKILGQSRTK